MSEMTPEEYALQVKSFEENEKNSLFEALKELTMQQIGKVQDLRKNYPLDAIDLMSSQITNTPNIKDSVREELSLLHTKIKVLIITIAQSIESKAYEFTYESIKNIELSYKENERAMALIDSDKKRLVSIRTLNLTIDIFNKFNQLIQDEIDNAVSTKNLNQEKKMLLANAIIFYELTDFLI